jgi:putative DNA primase/helicase
VLRDDDAGRLLVTCWGGCDRLELLAELRRRGLLDLTHLTPLDPTVSGQFYTIDEGDAFRIARARAGCDAALPAMGSPVARYLTNRGITIAPPATLRWSPRCWHGELNQELPEPMMVSRSA